MMVHPHDRTLASAAAVTRSTASEGPAAVGSAYRLLVIRGLSAVEAGNVVAYVTGLHPTERGWTVEEINHLVAIRSLVEAGVIDS